MINLAEGNFVVIKEENFGYFLEDIGIREESIPYIVNGTMTVEVRGPTHMQNPHPGFWYLSEKFGMLHVEYVFYEQELIPKRELYLQDQMTLNCFSWLNPFELYQTKSSHSMSSSILRRFGADGLIMNADSTDTNAVLEFERVDNLNQF